MNSSSIINRSTRQISKPQKLRVLEGAGRPSQHLKKGLDDGHHNGCRQRVPPKNAHNGIAIEWVFQNYGLSKVFLRFFDNY